ncbi:MAG TPA: hypothetical protein PKH65_10660 [Bacteroidia bacterium]|nr:hypothetical protein [Bacteroidia bacterium]
MQELKIRIHRNRSVLLTVILVLFSLPFLTGAIFLPFQSSVPILMRILMTLFYVSILFVITYILLINVKGFYYIINNGRETKVVKYPGLFSKTTILKGRLVSDTIDYGSTQGSRALLVMIGFLSRYKLVISDTHGTVRSVLWLNNKAQVEQVNSFVGITT